MVSDLFFIGAWLLRFCGSRNIFYFPVKADFNGDGKSDILWQNSVDGQRVIWFMNGTSYSSYADLGIVATSCERSGSQTQQEALARARRSNRRTV
jgi:hypothetical protein